ncbi:hypothetical protein E2F50_07970 [Rhizobium deserti]|uniref:Uncharacterized protein n=1 Tax=Rhizobium deserti TaxID=2547961 RepID=A0A4R5UJB9_9HYPH|nr:hypothetical protein [Rhizobium deserti]TDK36839.1 hypothetical protein E2F50_07970 [Rhizobium deserti]
MNKNVIYRSCVSIKARFASFWFRRLAHRLAFPSQATLSQFIASASLRAVTLPDRSDAQKAGEPFPTKQDRVRSSIIQDDPISFVILLGPFPE